jgi:hypothetical protein
MGMGYMVYTAVQQKNEMYDDDYYAKELKYQSTMDAANNLNTIFLGEIMKDTAGRMILQLPATTYEKFKEGKIQMLRADDKSKDIHMTIDVDSVGCQIFSNDDISKGYYNTRISWVNDTTSFYKEQRIYIK